MVKIFRWFYRFLFVYKVQFVVFLVVLTLAMVLGSLNPFFYKLLLDNLPGRDYQKLIQLLVIFVGVRILANLGYSLGDYLGDSVLIPASKDARVKIFRHLQDLDFAFHVNKNTGSLISAFKRGDGAFWGFFYAIHHEIFGVLVGLAVTLFFFSSVSGTLSLILLGIFAGNALLSWRLIKINIQKRRAQNEAEDRVSGIITDNLLNYETVKFFAQEKKEEKRLENEFLDWLKAVWGYSNTFRLMDVTIGTFSNLGVFLIFWIVLKDLIAGAITPGDFIMVATFISGFYYQFFNLLYNLRDLAKNYADIQRYFSILDEAVQVTDSQEPVRLKKVKGEIVFDKISFRYPDNQAKALKDFSLKINPGEAVAFAGRSGAGKTTVVKLLLRFYDVSRGKITLDGVDIRQFAKSQLRSYFGVVPQEPILFNNTIAYNIGYGKGRPTQTAIIKAAKAANLHSFIERLPLKYKTEVGERGIKLSGGQKQRLAIARMFLIDPRVIIFDEATSNLDSESERLIQRALWKIAEDRTVLIIAHRFSTLRRAHRIVVMDDGRIVETGSHQDLMTNKNGLYQYLWKLQTKGELEK